MSKCYYLHLSVHFISTSSTTSPIAHVPNRLYRLLYTDESSKRMDCIEFFTFKRSQNAGDVEQNLY